MATGIVRAITIASERRQANGDDANQLRVHGHYPLECFGIIRRIEGSDQRSINDNRNPFSVRDSDVSAVKVGTKQVGHNPLLKEGLAARYPRGRGGQESVSRAEEPFRGAALSAEAPLGDFVVLE
jgi:hypothetical protein